MAFDIKPVTSKRPTDCGATCLKMFLSYYGIDVDLKTLIEECNTGIIGCTGGDLLRVGRAHGLADMIAYGDVEGGGEPWKGPAHQDRPSIIWWMYNHWVVCGGIDEATGKVVIYNPDRGRYKVSEGTFNSFYSGVALFDGEPSDV